MPEEKPVQGVVRDEHGPSAPDGPMVPRFPPGYELNSEPLFDVAMFDEPAAPRQRRYLPELPDLIDRLTICQLKAIFIPEHAAQYRAEIDDMLHDIDLLLEGKTLDARGVRAVALIMLANRFIWENESKARAGGPEQDKLLKLTHSVNGIRNQAKNQLAALLGGRKDLKTDCLASDLPLEYGNWDVFR